MMILVLLASQHNATAPTALRGAEASVVSGCDDAVARNLQAGPDLLQPGHNAPISAVMVSEVSVRKNTKLTSLCSNGKDAVTTQWWGNYCEENSTKIQWKRMATSNPTHPVYNTPDACSWNAASYTAQWEADWVGGCGESPQMVALPTHGDNLTFPSSAPSSYDVVTVTEVSTILRTNLTSLCSNGNDEVTTQWWGNYCEENSAKIQWKRMTTLNPTHPVYNTPDVCSWNEASHTSEWKADWMGGCGESPQMVTLPTLGDALHIPSNPSAMLSPSAAPSISSEKPSATMFPSAGPTGSNEPSITTFPSISPTVSVEPSITSFPSTTPSISDEPSITTFPSFSPSIAPVPSITKLMQSAPPNA